MFFFCLVCLFFSVLRTNWDVNLSVSGSAFNKLITGSIKYWYWLRQSKMDVSNKVAIQLRVVQFWSEIILVISNWTCAACSFNFEITHMITDQIALLIINFKFKGTITDLTLFQYITVHTYMYSHVTMYSRLSVIASVSACFSTGRHAVWEPSTHCWLNNHKTFPQIVFHQRISKHYYQQ